MGARRASDRYRDRAAHVHVRGCGVLRTFRRSRVLSRHRVDHAALSVRLRRRVRSGRIARAYRRAQEERRGRARSRGRGHAHHARGRRHACLRVVDGGERPALFRGHIARLSRDISADQDRRGKHRQIGGRRSSVRAFSRTYALYIFRSFCRTRSRAFRRRSA